MGKVVTGTGQTPAELELDAARLQLATRIFQGAGEARRLATRGERAAAVAAVGPDLWLEAWEEAVGTAADRLSQHIGRRFDAHARAVRLPRRIRRRRRADAVGRGALTARLGSAGAPLIAALNGLERVGAAAERATGLERATVEHWQDLLRTAARRLEAAWLDLERRLESELLASQTVMDDVAQWRRPWWPVTVVGPIVLGVALWLGLVLGGYLTPPSWLAQLWQQVVLR